MLLLKTSDYIHRPPAKLLNVKAVVSTDNNDDNNVLIILVTKITWFICRTTVMMKVVIFFSVIEATFTECNIT